MSEGHRKVKPLKLGGELLVNSGGLVNVKMVMSEITAIRDMPCIRF